MSSISPRRAASAGRQADPSIDSDPGVTDRPDAAADSPPDAAVADDARGAVKGDGRTDLPRYRGRVGADSVEHVADRRGDVERE